MFSYPEFPIQIKEAFQLICKEKGLTLNRQNEDHYLMFKNKEWKIHCHCNHGALEFEFQYKDEEEFDLIEILKCIVPEAEELKQVVKNTWGSKSSVDWYGRLIQKYFTDITSKYSLWKPVLIDDLD